MNHNWWKEAVVYQIYPKSFMDSDNDGVGDLSGITQKLDYIAELGVSIIWISPYFKSPGIDNGYDISDYQAIDPQMGSMEDWKTMVDEMHKRGLKLIMDLVVNHCSDQHPWFQEAKKSKENPYRYYFIWQDPKDNGREPNNWESYFSGPAWEYDENTEQYYLHLFAKQQPDLNWKNPSLRQEIFKMMNWWVEQGVDGFRLDVMHAYAKEDGYPDGNSTGVPKGVEHYASIPQNHIYIKEMNEEVFSKHCLFTVGETDGITVSDGIAYSSEASKEVNTVFQFEHTSIESEYENRWIKKGELPIRAFKTCLINWQKGLAKDGWNSLYLSNHDQPRQVSRFGNDTVYWKESAKMLAMIMHLQKGTPYVFQGEEIGMTNQNVNSLEEVADIESINAYHAFVNSGKASGEQMLEGINRWGRDNARTPMQWDASDNAGFSKVRPWISVNQNYRTINVEAQKKDHDSILNFYKSLIHLRKTNPVVVYGVFEEIYEKSEEIFCFTRTLEDIKLLVIANMTEKNVDFEIPGELNFKKAQLYLANYSDISELESRELRPYEAMSFTLYRGDAYECS